MATLVERLLDAAEVLLRASPTSNAARRRAISTAYYAVFHRLAKLCAEEFVADEPRDTTHYEAVYRALQHGSAKEAFGRSPLSSSTVIRAIGAAFVTLQSDREKADYAPPDPRPVHARPCPRIGRPSQESLCCRRRPGSGGSSILGR